MDNIANSIEDGVATLTDALDKVRTPKSRAADTIERVGKLREGDISPAVIALQMKENTEINFSEADIRSYEKLYEASKSQVAITKKQTVALMQDQQETSSAQPQGA